MTNHSDPLKGTTREQLLADTFVHLADTLVDDYDVVELLDHLVAACIDLLRVSAAGLLLGEQSGPLAVVASSSEETRLIEIFQLQNDEGPCLECLRRGEVVAEGHLADNALRWPLFAPAAVSAGFHSVAAIPMRLRSHTIGALNLFDTDPEPVSGDDQRLARALADVATIGILQQRTVQHGTAVSDQLQHALNSRIVIEQGKGMLAERHAIDMPAAAEALRSYARSRNLKLTDVATRVVQGQLDPSLIYRRPSSTGSDPDRDSAEH